MMTRARVREVLQRACSRNLWMAVPPELEDYIVDYAIEAIPEEDIDDSAYGMLFEVAVACALWWHAGVLDPSEPDPFAQGNEYPVVVPPTDATTTYDTVVTTECL